MRYIEHGAERVETPDGVTWWVTVCDIRDERVVTLTRMEPDGHTERELCEHREVISDETP